MASEHTYNLNSKSSLDRARHRLAALMVTPAALLVVTFLVAVLALLLGLSLQQERATSISSALTLETWRKVFTDPYVASLWQRSVRIAFVTALVALVIAWPVAWALTRLSGWLRIVGFTLIAAPMLFSVVVRGYGWVLLLLPNGAIARTLPFPVLYTEIAVILTLVHAVLPFAVLPLYSVLRAIPARYVDAARDLGASRARVLLTILMPLSAPGSIAAMQIVFTLSISSYVIPRFMGGGRTPVLASDIYGNLEAVRWPIGAAEAILLIVTALVVVGSLSLAAQKLDWRRAEGKALS